MSPTLADASIGYGAIHRLILSKYLAWLHKACKLLTNCHGILHTYARAGAARSIQKAHSASSWFMSCSAVVIQTPDMQGCRHAQLRAHRPSATYSFFHRGLKGCRNRLGVCAHEPVAISESSRPLHDAFVPASIAAPACRNLPRSDLRIQMELSVLDVHVFAVQRLLG